MEFKKNWIFLFGLVLIFLLAGFVLAVPNYDQKVYRVDSKLKNNYNSERCSNCYNYNNYEWDYGNQNREIVCSDNYGFRNYDSYKSEKTKKSIFGDYIKEYSVQIRNRGYTGRYFTVVFKLKDKNGFEFTQSITKYLRDGESKKFVYKDIQYERHEILNWGYSIVPGK